MRHIIILWHILLMPLLGYSQICGVVDTTIVSQGAVENISIDIAPGDLVNDDLSDPNQGLCGIEISFVHQYVTDLGLSLESPDGQVVQLTGPTTISTAVPPTFGASWRITFLPSSEVAVPDPNFTSRWNNNLNSATFQAGGQYRGSYYPFNGNLEDFNTGTVSGTWTLRVDNSQSFNGGAILAIRLIFCDPLGQDCCFADAGRLDDPDLDACIGDPDLNFVPESRYSFPPPDTDLYGFTYLVSRDSILLAYDSTEVDLTDMPAGTYQVCGLSYLRADSLLLPQPDGQYSLKEMFSDLNSLSPSFCGDLTGDCQLIVINEPPLPVDLPVVICEGETFTYQDSTYDQAGTFPYILQTASGCDSLVNIVLTVVPTQTVAVDSTICAGETVQIGNSVYNTTGMYRDTLPSGIGCDSVVVLDLEVVQDIIVSLDTVICRGDSLVVNGQAYYDTDNFQVTLPSSRICDSIVMVNLRVLDPLIELAPVDTITCARPTVTLDAGASTPVGSVIFEWQDLAGASLGMAGTLTVDEPGDYVLLVSEEVNGQRCTVRDTVRVVANESFPVADAGPDQTLTCVQEILTLGGSGTSIGSEYIYEWTTDTGNFLDDPDIPAPRIDAPGHYTLIVTNTSSNCMDTSTVMIDALQELPAVFTSPDTTITCTNRSLLLTSDGSSQGAMFEYEWRNSQGDVLGNDPSLRVAAADTYRLIIRNTLSSCTDSAEVSVAVDTLLPQFSIDAPPAINCDRPTIRLNAVAPALDTDVTITWDVTDGGNIQADAGTLTPLVDAAGTYTLILNNTRNGCESFASVEVADIRNTQTAAPLVPDIISCGVSSVVLDAGTSNSGPNVVYQWTTSDGQFVDLSTGRTVRVNAAGTYTLTVLDTISRCSDMASVEVFRDLNSPVAEAGNGFAVDCAMGQDTLRGTGSSEGVDISYTWTGPCLESNPDSLWVVASCAGMYYLEVTDLSNNCSVIDSVEVVLDQNAPIAAVLPVDTITCAAPSVLLDGSPSTPANDLQFSWTGPGITGTTTDPAVSVDIPGIYQLVVANALNGCTDTLAVEVAMETVLPSADAGDDLTLTCAITEGMIGGPNTSTGPDLSYSWIEIEGQLPGATDTPVVPVDGAGIFRLIVTNNRTGCRDSSQVVVVENNELPGSNAGPDQEINCSSDRVDLDGSNSVQGPDIVYTWSGPCLIGRTDSIGARADCPGTYLLEVTNMVTGCSTMDSVVITLNPAAPFAVLPDTASIDCAAGTATLDGSASSTGFYEWTLNGAVVSAGANLINVAEVGVYYLSVENQDGSCTAQDSMVVIGNCQPEAIILPSDDLTCEEPTVVLDAGNSRGQALRYEWTGPDPGCIVGGQGTPQLEVSCGGTYTLILTNEQVMLSDTQTVTVAMDDNMPVATVGPPDTLNCVQNVATLDGSASTTGPNIVYRWTRVSNGALIAETATATTQVPGTFVLEVLDTVSLCSSTASVRIVEFNLPISLSFGDSVLACGQDTFALTALPTPLSDFYTYNWSGPEILVPSDSATVLAGEVGAYSVTVTDRRSECTATATVNLTEDQQCAPCVTIATPDTLSCARMEVSLEAAFCRPCTGCALQWTTADGNIVADGNTLQPTVDAVGTYRLTVIDLEGFQTDVDVTVVENNPFPPAGAGPDRIITCDSMTVTLGNSAGVPDPSHAYEWSSPDVPGFSDPATRTAEVNEPGTYVVLVTDINTGCFTRDTALVTIDTLRPLANAGPDQMLSCNDPFVILNGGGSSSGSEYQFTWSGSDAAACLQGMNAVNPIVNCPGTYYLEIRNRNTGCSDLDTVQVFADDDLAVLTPFPDTALSCSVDSVTLIAGLAEPENYAYRWCALDTNGQEVASSCRDSLRLPVGTTGAYRFTAINDNTGCESTFTVNVADERDLPLIDAGPDLRFRCTDDSLLVSAETGQDLIDLDIAWTSLGKLPIGNANTLNPIIYAADTLLLTVTDRQSGCTAMDSVVIAPDLNAPAAEAGADTALTCLVTSLQLQGGGSSNSGNALTYAWTTADGNIQANANTATPRINRPGTYLLTVSNAQNGCTATDAVVVRDEQSAPVASIADLGSLQFSCNVDTLLLDASGSVAAGGGPLDYLWTIVSSGNLIGPTDQPTIQTDAIGTYRLIVSDPGSSCRDSLQFTLSAAFGAPVIRIDAPQVLTCSRDEVIIDASASEFGSNYTATWMDDQGNVLPASGLSLAVSEPGNFTLQIDNLQSGCTNLSQPISVRQDTTAPTVVISPTDLLDCTITSVTLDGSASSGSASLTYQWTTAGGILLSGDHQSRATAGGAGTYILEIQDVQNGCTALDSIQVEAITAPIAGLDLQMTSPGCTNAAGGSILVNEVIGGTAPFIFQLNDGAEVNTGTFTQLRTGTYTVRVRDVNGCEWQEELVIPEAAPIDVDLGPDLTITSGDSIELIAQTSSRDIVSYRWEPAIADGSMVVVAPEVTTSYGITVTDVNGCSATDRVRVIVKKTRSYFIPNAFSPDGDGSNDRFMVMTGPDVVNIPTFRIYDRWGHLVYERHDIPPNDPALGWDGRHNGSIMNSGVFVYYVELEYNDGTMEIAQGDVALLR
ncbi:gliding motility-associated C-terminal domain-containing protein [Flavilitoribacter nigricans]|uniref:P/Homo B domain-containing protein n=1 Tax=Flavilitoribacter nigricans (strain ATCC 23147 / DSM 23189 / NBRC 102662 / NCIMB 1420 / SS-2) TaxID=1122177 RepID=A0A2D0MX64_FLAN2|nr:gliding motility-associated C-terminal domain-containing protein [Flavilitoribacter nigricans]PHN00862.1 hypothetical protein CRP01_39940 [Flavilitoribacter nigricans DSM 23189 = NBRC 102662]